MVPPRGKKAPHPPGHGAGPVGFLTSVIILGPFPRAGVIQNVPPSKRVGPPLKKTRGGGFPGFGETQVNPPNEIDLKKTAS